MIGHRTVGFLMFDAGELTGFRRTSYRLDFFIDLTASTMG
jgi:hypothetical protein